MIPFWRKPDLPAPDLVALSAEIPLIRTLFVALGESQAQDFLQRAAQRLAHVAAAQGGIVVRTDSSSLLVLFEQADSALSCARALRRDLARWVQPIAQDVDVHVNIGISRGRIQGRPPECEGQTLVQANALAAAAQGGQILLDAAVVQQLPPPLRVPLQRVRRWEGDAALTDAWMDPPDHALTPGGDLLWLHLQRPQGGPEQIVTPGSVIHIGRSSHAQLQFQREDVSRQHAVVLWCDGDYTLTDLSTNGTWLQYGFSGAVVRVHRSAVVLRAAGALYFGHAPVAGQPPDLRFLVDRPGRPISPGNTTPQPPSVTPIRNGTSGELGKSPECAQS